MLNHFNVEVERITDNKLYKETWKFVLMENGELVLDMYMHSERYSTRHKFNVVDYYSRLNDRNATRSIDNVPFPDDVRTEAMFTLIGKITVVKKWSRG